MSTHLALAAIAVMLLAAGAAALFGRSPGTRLTGVAVLVAVMAVLAVLSLVAGHGTAALLLGAGVAVTVHLAVCSAFRRPRPGPEPVPWSPPLAEHRYDLTGHTITIEDGPGGPVVVERARGQFFKVVRTSQELAFGETPEMVAEAAASAYGARYVPAERILGGAR